MIESSSELGHACVVFSGVSPIERSCELLGHVAFGCLGEVQGWLVDHFAAANGDVLKSLGWVRRIDQSPGAAS